MLEKPDLPDDALVACVEAADELRVAALSFLPLGADVKTAVYRLRADDGTELFVKLRRGELDGAGVLVPRFLRGSGVENVMSPLASRSDQLWTRVEPFTVMAYPYVTGSNGFEIPLTDDQWKLLGGTLRRVHDTAHPTELAASLPREPYSSV
jgi:spectinomycin phosphotransferase